MKHAAVLYTCIGLMGTAAVTGFVDYTHSSKAGLLNDLYAEDRASTGSTFLPEKKINIDDYSRGPIEVYAQDQQKEFVLNAQPKKHKKSKKTVPPPPPPKPGVPPPPQNEKNIPPPPPPPKKDITEVITEVPVAPEAPPVTEEKIEVPPTPPVPVPEVIEVKKLSFESFSRAPLKKMTVKRKKN